VETNLLREIVRHGDEVIYDHVETEDGETITLNVAQYIDYDLGQDDLRFSSPLYNQILAEAVAHSGDPEFRAESYFTNHADIAVSQLATSLVIDRHQLGRRFIIQPREGMLRQRIEHLVMDFRLAVISQHMKEIQTNMRQVNGDMERIMQLMKDYKETKELHDMLARKLGRDVG
jgi:DNA primase